LLGWAAALALWVPVGAHAGAGDAPSGTALTEALTAEVQRLAREATTALWGNASPAPRTEVVVGTLDPRLKLAPCQQVVPYLPPGARPLGRTRIGLRCLHGSTRWNVSLPVTIKLWAPSLVAASALPAGTVLAAGQLVSAEVDLAERPDPAISQGTMALGRTLARGLSTGEALRRGDLKTRKYFNAGDTVRIVATGPGYAISSEGLALGPGLEGQSTRVRTDSGRVLTGVATADRRVEVAL
jgi:flagella basal body P-ring formation protein FlgA